MDKDRSREIHAVYNYLGMRMLLAPPHLSLFVDANEEAIWERGTTLRVDAQWSLWLMERGERLALPSRPYPRRYMRK